MHNEGIIEEVHEHEICCSHSMFYLPHHPVVKESSLTTKVRPVFDASAMGFNGKGGIYIQRQRWWYQYSKARVVPIFNGKGGIYIQRQWWYLYSKARVVVPIFKGKGGTYIQRQGRYLHSTARVVPIFI